MPMINSSMYLAYLQESLPGKEFINGLMCVIEVLPIFYSSLVFSISLNGGVVPSFFENYLKYLSYYTSVRKHFNDTVSLSLLIIITALLIFFILYKYIFVKYITKFYINSSIIIFYEVFVMRTFAMTFIETQVLGIMNDSFFYNIFSSVLLALTCFGILNHFYKEEMYLNFSPKKKYLMNSHLYTQYQIYHLILKVIICFVTNTDQAYKTIAYCLKCLVIIMHYGFFVFVTGLLVKDKYTFLLKNSYLVCPYFVNLLICVISISMFVIGKYDGFYFFIMFANGLFMSFFITWLACYFSFQKVLKKGNELSALLYLISIGDDKNFRISVTKKIIMSYNMRNEKKESQLLSNRVPTKKGKKKADEVNVFIKEYFKEIVKKNYSDVKCTDDKERTLYYLIDFYISYFSQSKTFTWASIKYHKAVNLALSQEKKPNVNDISFLANFKENLFLIYYEIKKTFHSTENETKNSYLISIDSMLTYIQIYEKKLQQFLSLEIKSPSEILQLSLTFSQLKKKMNLDILSSKEYKYSYQCILCQFILETICNKRISPNFYITETIHSFDDLLSYKYEGEKLILSCFNLSMNSIEIKRCCKELILLEGKNFEKIFPPCFAKEGIRRTIKILTSKKSQQLEFYFYHPVNESIELIYINFAFLPSLDKKNFDELYFLSQYRIVYDRLIMFEKRSIGLAEEELLAGMSTSTSKFLDISPKMVREYLDNRVYLKKEECVDDRNFLKIKAIHQVIKSAPSEKKKKEKNVKLRVDFKEEISKKFQIYHLEEIGKESKDFTTRQDLTTQENKEINSIVYTDFNINLDLGNSGTSSSCGTNSSFSVLKNHVNEVKSEKSTQFRQFYRYNYYFVSFDILLIIGILIFLFLELNNNSSLKYLFKVITNFNNFQCYFYHITISIFSLSCVAGSVTDQGCDNKFIQISKEFSKENNLTENEMLMNYVFEELPFKAEFILTSLTQWNKDKSEVATKKMSEIFNQIFDYYTVSELDGLITPTVEYMSFSDAVKNYVDLIHLLSNSDDYPVSPVYLITIDGNNFNDLSNAYESKTPINGTFLDSDKRNYYTVIMNFQKYIRKLLKIGDLLTEKFDEDTSDINKIIVIFIIVFILVHLAMMSVILKFTFKYRKLHKEYYYMIYYRISEKESVRYYQNKIDIIFDMLKFYKENPVLLVNKLEKLKQKENHRRTVALKNKATEKEPLNKSSEESFDQKEISNKYNKILTLNYLTKIFGAFSGYIMICIMFYFIIVNGIHRLSVTNRYAKLNYDISNYIFTNFCLTQLMTLTNQTDIGFYYYFSDQDVPIEPVETIDSKKYVKEKIEEIISSNKKLLEMEKKYDFFISLSEMLDINCDTLYHDIDDSMALQVIEAHPESRYTEMLAAYCKSFLGISYYKDDRLSVDIVTYQTSQLLNAIKGRSYEELNEVNELDVLFSIYTEVLFILRPIRRYTSKFLANKIIGKIISDYELLIILFIIFNFVYDIGLILFLKIKIIDTIVNKSREIMDLALSFECF